MSELQQQQLLLGSGCVVSTGGNDTASIYKIDQFNNFFEINNGSLAVIDRISVGDSDIVSTTSSLNWKSRIYVYGKSITEIVVNGTLFLGPVHATADGHSAEHASLIKQLTSDFDKHRLSKSYKGNMVSIAEVGGTGSGFKTTAYFSELLFGDTDPRFNIIKFTLKGYCWRNSNT